MAVLVFLVYFYTGLVIEKTKFSTKSARKYAILTPQIPKNVLGRGHCPSPCGEGDIPSPHPIPLGAFGTSTKALDFGPQLQLLDPPMSELGEGWLLVLKGDGRRWSLP